MKKLKKLDSCHFFTPVAIETTGVFGPRTTEFLKELGHRLRQVSGEANSYAYLTQRLSVAVQRGNAASMLGTVKVDGEDEEFFPSWTCAGGIVQRSQTLHSSPISSKLQRRSGGRCTRVERLSTTGSGASVGFTVGSAQCCWETLQSLPVQMCCTPKYHARFTYFIY